MMLERIIMDRIKFGDGELEGESFSEKKKENEIVENTVNTTELKKIVSYLPLPRPHQEDNSLHLKMRDQIKANISRVKSHAIMMKIAALIGDSKSYGR